MSTPNQPQPTTEPEAHPRPDGWWAYPPGYALAVYVAGTLPNLAWWVPTVAGLALAGIGWAIARVVWHPDQYGSTLSGWVAGCLAATGLGTGAWLYTAQLAGPLAVWQYLAAGAAVGWAWWALVMLVAPSAAARMDAALLGPEQPAAVLDDPKAAQYRAVLERLVPEVEVLGVTTSDSGGVDTVRIGPADSKDITRAAFEAKLPRIVTALAHLYAGRGIDLQEEDIAVEAGRHAAEWHMLVTTARVLARNIPYEPATGPQPWVGPKKMGYWEDDQPLELTTFHEEKGAAHGDIVMATGEGKTNILNNIIRRHLESDEGEVWLIGVEKLVKLAWMWLTPWLAGQANRPAIDWVAGETPGAALRALAAAYQYAVLSNRKQRGNKARRPTRGKGGLLIVLDEKSYLLSADGLGIPCFDGVTRNASQLVAALVKLGRTAPVSVISANQDKLMGSAGVAGAEQSRNQNIGIVGKVNSGYDAYAAIPGLSPRMNPQALENNAIYQVSPHDPRRQLRGKYFKIEDEEIPVAAAELTQYRYGLDPAIASQLQYYADRWDPRWHAEFIAELADEPDLRWPVAPGGAPAAPPVEKQPADAAAAHGEPDWNVDLGLHMAAKVLKRPDLAQAWIDAHHAGTLDPRVFELARLVTDDTIAEDDPRMLSLGRELRAELAASTTIDRTVGQKEPVTVPAPAEDNDTPPEGLPDGWTDPNFDIWQALGQVDGAEADPTVPMSTSGSDPNGIFNADTSEIEAALAKMQAWHAENATARKSVGEPLESVLFILSKPGAPEWVPTEVLALAIGRIQPDMEKPERDKAIAQLGLDLNRQTKISSQQLLKEHDERQRKGYRTAELVEAGRRLAETA